MLNIPLNSAKIIIPNGEEYTLLAPEIKDTKGVISVSGLFDIKEFQGGIKEIVDKFNMKWGNYSKSHEDLFKIVATGVSNNQITVYPVDFTSFNHQTLKVSFVCYGYFEDLMKFQDNNDVESIYSIGFEGMTLCFDSTTRTTQTRTSFGKQQELSVGVDWDHSNSILYFNHEGHHYYVKVMLVKRKESKQIDLIFDQETPVPIEVFTAIKWPLTAFLSYGCGNNISIREENLIVKEGQKKRIYSGKRLIPKSYSNYIPLNDYGLRADGILNKYFTSFNLFLFVENKLRISEAITLFNFAKKARTVDESIYMMLVSIEALAERFKKSEFIDIKSGFYMDQELFNEKIKHTKRVFESDFAFFKIENKKDYYNLLSNLGSINRISKTNIKIYELFKFAELSEFSSKADFFNSLRQKAIHEGEMNLPEANAFHNQIKLELIFNEIIANIIQYKFERYLRTEERTKHGKVKNDFVTDYTKFGFS
jgi:hypothetical protein